jgi:alkylated DNA nucleotide flippase Atl1
VKVTAVEKMAMAKPREVKPLSGAGAARLRASTLLIPHPNDLIAALQSIPKGSTRTAKEVREDLANQHGAEVTCPMVVGIQWRMIAEFADETNNAQVPWWRMTQDGKPNPRLPGGAERHRKLLREEGVEV